MRIRTAALSIAILCLPLTACGGDGGSDVKTRVKASSKAGAAHGAAKEARDAKDTEAKDESAAGKPHKPKVARVGDTISLKGQEAGEKLDVTVIKWLDPAKSADEFSTPAAGKRWVAAQIQLVNTGSATYSDSPSNGVQVADSQGQRFEATIGEITAGPQMTSDLKLPAGDKALGWIVLEVPKASTVPTLQFTMNSGFAEQTGQWKIK